MNKVDFYMFRIRIRTGLERTKIIDHLVFALMHPGFNSCDGLYVKMPSKVGRCIMLLLLLLLLLLQIKHVFF